MGVCRCRVGSCRRSIPKSCVTVLRRQKRLCALWIVSWVSLSACFVVSSWVQQQSLWDIHIVTDYFFMDNSTVFGASATRINTHPLRFLISPPTPCSRDRPPLNLLVAICSSTDNFEARVALRNTWASQSALQHVNASVVFVLGMPQSSRVQRRILRESAKYRDIIQSDFVDSYKNLSLKTMSMLKWVTTACPNLQYLLKADDDTFINMKHLAAILASLSLSRFLLGAVQVGALPAYGNSSKWAISDQEYSGQYYPKFCSGTAYVLSGDLIEDLYQMTQHTRLFSLEDVYITGFCAHLIDATHVHCSGFYLGKLPIQCNFSSVVSTHYVPYLEMYNYWGAVNSVGTAVQCYEFPPSLYVPPIIIACVIVIVWICRKCILCLRCQYNKLRSFVSKMRKHLNI